MAYIHDDVLDNGLEELHTYVSDLYICSTEPATYAEASSTYALGIKASPTVSSPGAGSPTGRQVTISAITDGSVTGNGTAAYWALVDDTPAAERLLAAGALSSSQVVTSGNTFTLTQFTIRIPDPA